MPIADQLFSFEGRLRRKDYWIASIILWLVIGAILAFVIAVATGLKPRAGGSAGFAIGLFMLAIFLGALWPAMAIGVKRCHDREKSGWWMLIWFILSLVPFLNILTSIWQLVELGFLDGTQGPNRFGPSPKGIGNDIGRLQNVFE